jgi:hypothetical protein
MSGACRQSLRGIALIRSPVVAGVILAAMLAGCLSEQSGDEPLRGFEATYQSSKEPTTRIEVKLSDVATITGRDREHRQAYALSVDSYHGVSPQMHRTYYLDGSLLVVRRDTCYDFVDPKCEGLEVTWEQHGQLAPLGLGLAGGPKSMVHYVDYEARELRFAKQRVESGFELELLNPEDAGKPLFPVGGLFDGEAVVLRTHPDERNAPLNRIRYEELGPLPAIDAWPQGRPVGSVAGWKYFPGDSGDDLKIGYSYAEIFDRLRGSVTQVEDWLQRGGCFIQFFFSVDSWSDGMITPLGTRGWTFTWRIADPDGQVWGLDGSLRRDLRGDQWEFQQEPSLRENTRRGCTSGATVAATTLDAALREGRAKAGFPPRMVQVSFPSSTVSEIQLAYHFSPEVQESGLTLLNHFEVNAATGHLTRADLPRESRSWL